MRVEVIWEQLIDGGLEHLIVDQDDHIEADGVAVGRLGNQAYRLQYHISCDADWRARSFSACNLQDNRRVSLSRRGQDWLDDGKHLLEALQGCSEPDVMVTPFTNTLPIRRLALTPGESAEISAVYVKVPDLVVSKVRQRYTMISGHNLAGIFRYQNLESGFSADLTTDADGLVTDYPGIFRLLWKKTDG